MENLMRTIFNSLSKRTLLPITLPIDWNKLLPNQIANQHIIYLAIADDTTRARVIVGKGLSITEAINYAINTWIEHNDESFDVKHVKFDIVKDISRVKKFKNTNSKLVVNSGIEGLAFDDNFNLSFSPQEVEAYGVAKERKLNLDRIISALSNQVNPGDLEIIREKNRFTLYKFTTESFYVNKNEVVPLIRGHRTFNEINKMDLKMSIKLTQKNYFRRLINKSGKQKYSYLPHINLNEKRYNILRHAGTIYSILESIELFKNDYLLEKCKLSLEFLIDKAEKKMINGKDALVLVERDTVKLGGNALAIVALAKYSVVTDDMQYLPVMQKLATWITETQAENGDFLIHKQTYSNEEVSDFRSDFYTGESILAMVRLYELDKNEVWLDVAEKATNFLVNEKNKGATLETVHFDHWLLYGINNLSRYRPNDSFFSHAMLIGKSLLKKQYLDDEYPTEWIGGFPPEVGTIPKSVPVACRSEGMANIYDLAKDKHPEFAQQIKECLIKSVAFQMQMQMRDEKVMYYENKKLCLGSFYNKLRAIELRNDFTQHNISSLIALYRII